MKKILLIEDDISLNRGIQIALTKENYEVVLIDSITGAYSSVKSIKFDLIILDVSLPDGNGFDFCIEFRKTSDVPIIFLTAQDSELDVTTGLDIGGDDYITKPFRVKELLSRVNAIMRRATSNTDYAILQSKEIILNIKDMKLTKNNIVILLSKTELKLLHYFLQNPQRILSKENIFDKLWDMDSVFVDDNAVAVNIRRLREKIEDNPSNPTYIQTIRGIGYIWAEGCVKK